MERNGTNPNESERIRTNRNEFNANKRIRSAQYRLNARDLPSTSQARLAHQPVGRRVRLAHPFDDFLRLRRVLQLDAHRPVDVQVLDLAEVWREIHDAAARRQVAVFFAVAITDMNVDRLALEPPQLGGS